MTSLVDDLLMAATDCEGNRYGELFTRSAATVEELEEARANLLEALGALMSDVMALANESRGVAGLHLNGDLAEWQELLPGGRFEEWLLSIRRAEDAIAKAKGETA